MRLLAAVRKPQIATGLAALAWLVASCGDDDDAKTQVQPIRVEQILFPDSVQAGEPDSVVVLAVVSYSGCTSGGVQITLEGDSLVVGGVYSCRYEVSAMGPEGPVGDGIRTDPAFPIEARVVLALPDLAAGTYRIVAEGVPGERLADTLVVANAPVTRHERIAGFAELFEHTVPACAALPVASRSQTYDMSLEQLYLVENPPGASGVPGTYEINATIVRPASCDVSFAGVLRLRNAIRW